MKYWPVFSAMITSVSFRSLFRITKLFSESTQCLEGPISPEIA